MKNALRSAKSGREISVTELSNASLDRGLHFLSNDVISYYNVIKTVGSNQRGKFIRNFDSLMAP